MTKTGTAAETATYYRTTKGSHRHASRYCANFRRSILLGDVIVIPAAEVTDWAPCADCTTEADQAAAITAAAVKADAMCANTGVRNPRCIQSECRDCGKRGTVNRSTGSLRAHKPQV
jgi:hypothetical protein